MHADGLETWGVWKSAQVQIYKAAFGLSYALCGTYCVLFMLLLLCVDKFDGDSSSGVAPAGGRAATYSAGSGTQMATTYQGASPYTMQNLRF